MIAVQQRHSKLNVECSQLVSLPEVMVSARNGSRVMELGSAHSTLAPACLLLLALSAQRSRDPACGASAGVGWVRLILLRFMVCIMLMYDTMGLVTGPQGGPPTPNNGLHFRAAVTAPALVMKACIYLSIYLCIYVYTYIYIYISTYIICMCTHTIYLYTYIYIYTHGVHLQNLNSLKPKPRGHEQLPRGRDSREARHHRFRGSGCRV